jgi:hypothetical protein
MSQKKNGITTLRMVMGNLTEFGFLRMIQAYGR